MSLGPPNALLALTDGPRALVDVAVLGAARPLLRRLPAARDKHSVMVIPGFLGDDRGNQPLIVHQVITLGSPFGRGHEGASHASRLYQRLNPQRDSRDNDDRISTPPPVPTTAIYTRADGVVNWRTSMQDGDYAHVHNIEVPGSHIGLNLNAAVWYWVAKKLARI